MVHSKEICNTPFKRVNPSSLSPNSHGGQRILPYFCIGINFLLRAAKVTNLFTFHYNLFGAFCPIFMAVYFRNYRLFMNGGVGNSDFMAKSLLNWYKIEMNVESFLVKILSSNFHGFLVMI